MQKLNYIEHPIIVRLAGKSVTHARAFICTAACLFNGVVLLLPIGKIESAWEIPLLILWFFIFDVGFFGTISVASLYAFGFFVAIVTKIIYSEIANIKDGCKLSENQAVVEEWTINIFILVSEFIIGYMEFTGKF